MDFGDFFDIKYDKDAEDQVYPDMYKEIERGEEEKKKKDLGGKSFTPEEKKGGGDFEI